MKLIDATKVIDGKRYSTKAATLIADNEFWDGNNMERGGTNTWLFRTAKGNYFSRTQSQWQGSTNSVVPLTEEGAMEAWESLREKHVEFEDAFPRVTVEDA